MSSPEDTAKMVEIELGRLVLRDHSVAAPQYIYLREVGGQRSFPIIIGLPEASEIQRIVTGDNASTGHARHGMEATCVQRNATLALR